MMSGDDERLGGSSFLEIKGWLWKKNQSFGWVKRYVCLDSNLLEYYGLQLNDLTDLAPLVWIMLNRDQPN